MPDVLVYEASALPAKVKADLAAWYASAIRRKGELLAIWDDDLLDGDAEEGTFVCVVYSKRALVAYCVFVCAPPLARLESVISTVPGKGYGRLACSAAEGIARKLGCREVYVQPQGIAGAFYAHLGFVPAGTGMIKALSPKSST